MGSCVRPHPYHQPGPGPVLALIAGWPHVDIHAPTGCQVPSRPRGDGRRCRLFPHAAFWIPKRSPPPQTCSRASRARRTSSRDAPAPFRASRRPIATPSRWYSNEALTPFVSALAVGQAKIVPQGYRRAAGRGIRGAIRSAPDRSSSSAGSAGKEIVLAANPDSFDGPPRLARLVYRIFPGEANDQICQEFEQGNLEESPVPPMCRNKIGDPRYQYVRRPTFSVRFYGLNTRAKPLSDVRVRQAIAHALDRETMIQEIFLGQHQPARGILPPGMPGYNPQLEDRRLQPGTGPCAPEGGGLPRTGAGCPPSSSGRRPGASGSRRRCRGSSASSPPSESPPRCTTRPTGRPSRSASPRAASHVRVRVARGRAGSRTTSCSSSSTRRARAT